MLEKIISGGQTGVDRAALDAAIRNNISHGGWCPKGRLAELGSSIPTKYQLIEAESSEFSERTRLNIRDADGTLILIPMLSSQLRDGTVLTIEEVKNQQKPYLIISIDKANHKDIKNIVEWIESNKIKVLNIAGPGESQSPGIYLASLILIEKILGKLHLFDLPPSHI